MDKIKKNTIEVCFSPALYEYKLTKNKFITVIVDVLRATTSICAALDHGIKEIIPVAGVKEARKFKTRGFLVACERNGQILDFADSGNSPSDFFVERFRNQTIVFSTTNGTKAIHLAQDADEIVTGSFSNLSALADWLVRRNRNVVILCAAWKNLFNLEDSVYAGALTEKLLGSERFTTVCDSANGSLDLWSLAKRDLENYLARSSHRNRLKHLVTMEDFLFTITPDTTVVIPYYYHGLLIDINKK